MKKKEEDNQKGMFPISKYKTEIDRKKIKLETKCSRYYGY